MRSFRRIALGLSVISALAVSAGEARAQACGTTASTPLIAGQHYTAGTISISNDANFIYVQYATENPWVMSDAHVAVAKTLAEIPQTKSKNPIPGRFAYSATFDPEVTSHTFVVPLAGLYAEGQTVYIAAHALVQAPRADGGSQTGWGFGPGFAGSNWATYLAYTIQSCGGGNT